MKRNLLKKFKEIVKFIRTITGDNAYEEYVQNTKTKNRLNRKEFYLDKLDKKWNRINRCC
jgi:uncharacterized short protein YbdD (DUF466 family)